jgi:hypothetical protein
MNIIVRPSYKDIFPNQSSTIEEVLTNSNSNILFGFISLVIHEYDKKFDSEKKQFDFIFNLLLRQTDTKTIEKIKKQIITIKKKAEIYLFNRYTCLNLLEHSIRLSQKTKFIDNGETGLNIFKAFLLVNEEITKKEAVAGKLLNSKTNKFIEFHVAKLMPECDISYFNMHREFDSQFIKFFLFVDYLKENIELVPIINSFIKKKGISSFPDYFYKLFKILQVCITNYKFRISENETDQEFLQFLSTLTVSDFETFSNTDKDFIELRKHPIIKNSKDEYVVLFFPFLFNKSFNSLYFEFKELIDNQNIVVDKKLKNFKSFFNYTYSEKKLFTEAISLVYNKKYKQISGSEFKNSKIENAPDYYIRNGNKLFLFENKAISISQGTRTSFNIDLIIAELSKKLIENEKGKPKGLTQLKNYITSFQNGKYSNLDVNAKPSKCTIYPILIVHDNSFYTPGLNILINRWFVELIKEFDIKNRVKSVTIIHIDDLLYYTSNLSNLDTLIDKYIKFQEKENSTDSMYSFSDYINFKEIIDEKKLKTMNNKKIEKYLIKFIE